MKNIREYPRISELSEIIGEMPTGEKFAVYQDGKLYKADYATIFLFLMNEIGNYINGTRTARRK